MISKSFSHILRTALVIVRRNMAIRLFEGKDHANLYASYRPTHVENLYQEIVNYYDTGKGETCDYDLAVDVGCGNGQSTRPLCQYFKQVIGTDVSDEQIKLAKTDLPNLSFKCGPGEDLSFLENDSVDLITLASAIHWLDLENFFPEVIRVLKPGGVLAPYAYGNATLDKKDADAVFRHFYYDLTYPFFNKRRRWVDEHYSSIILPFDDKTRVETDSISIKREMPVDAVVGYLSTWSGWQAFLKANPDSRELELVRQRLKQVYGDDNVVVTWPVFLLMGRKPK